MQEHTNIREKNVKMDGIRSFMIGRIMVPKEIHSLISRAYDHIALRGKRDVIK